eukprot:1160391-Pelagomonas_calceolata.AAC.2
MSEACLGLVCGFGGFPRPREHVGHRQHGSDGQDLVGAPAQARAPNTATTAPSSSTRGRQAAHTRGQRRTRVLHVLGYP